MRASPRALSGPAMIGSNFGGLHDATTIGRIAAGAALMSRKKLRAAEKYTGALDGFESKVN